MAIASFSEQGLRGRKGQNVYYSDWISQKKCPIGPIPSFKSLTGKLEQI